MSVDVRMCMCVCVCVLFDDGGLRIGSRGRKICYLLYSPPGFPTCGVVGGAIKLPNVIGWAGYANT